MTADEYYGEQLVKYAFLFPSLREVETGRPSVDGNRFEYQRDPAPGLVPWNPCTFDAWAASQERNWLERTSAQFILWLYDPQAKWKCGRFDFASAVVNWDHEHRRAFAYWARNPLMLAITRLGGPGHD